MERGVGVTFSALLLACAASEPARHPPAPVASPRASASAPTAPPIDAGAAEAPEQELGDVEALGTPSAAPAALKLEREYVFSKHYPDELRVPPAQWLKDHGARGNFSEKDCWDLGPAVGVPSAPGLLCAITRHPPTEKLGRIYRLEGARVTRVWEATIGTDSNWLELVPVLSADGSIVELHDRLPGACERAICDYREKEESGIWMDFGPALERGYKQLGTYVYQDGRFVHTKYPDPERRRFPFACPR